ncbi:MAG: transcriptional regulator [Candidatus Thorarchaeota archaeon]|jgi:DNA-binding MarR family transcriptional regulator
MSLDGDLLNVLVGLMKEDRDTFVPARLSILVHLYFTQSAVFTSLQKTLKLTSGNLSSHLKKLQSLGFVRISKEFIELKPTTTVVITQEGAKKVRSQLLRLRELVSVVIEQGVGEQPSAMDGSTASTP